MATKTATPLTYASRLYESAGGASAAVDRDRAVIRNVKVLGFHSPNGHGQPGAAGGTDYTESAMRDALPLYEGVQVMVDHPDRSRLGAERSAYDCLGVLRNARLTPDGIRADLHLDPAHQLAESVMNDVERKLGRFGLSHNARGDGPVKNGRYVITTIEEVRSVDLVTRPATNKNLWESVPVKTTLRAILESRLPTLSKSRRLHAKTLLEMDEYATADMAGDAPASPLDAPVEVASDPDQALKDGFRAAIDAVLDDDSLDVSAKVKKISEYLKTHDKLTAAAEPAPPVAEADDEKDEAKDDEVKESACDTKDDDKKHTYESRELAALRSEKAARQLCESLKFAAPQSVIDTLAKIADADARKASAEAFKAAAAAKAADRPRSVPPGRPLAESRDGAGDIDAFHKRVLVNAR